ncbi:MAG: translation initiation factor IF-2 [Oscillospiraceae bacterium]|jgi:translation initiation factor IF-2|nr:translation initiation factor IF-2 [Oscillospiraceae bacterium]
MTYKNRVHEIAKDLKLKSKDISKLLEKYFDSTKKHMTVLTSEELDFILDYYTKKFKVEDLSEYFSHQKKPGERIKAKKIKVKEKKEKALNYKKIQEKSKSPPVKEMASKKNIFIKKNELKANLQKFDFAPKREQIKRNFSQNTQMKHHEVRVVDTRTRNVDLERFNEKYDRMASERGKFENFPGNTRKKQKFFQRNQGRFGLRRKRETETQRLRRITQERKEKAMTILIPDKITVGELARRLKATTAEIIKKLMEIDIMASVNDTIDFDIASLVANEFYAKVEKEIFVSIEEKIIDNSKDKEEDLEYRAPVVVVMGHVDHGKTSLLDTIRKTSVTESEFGGITQHIGAYRARMSDGYITFIDTPGHKAFTTMRARGTKITDIAILVIAADDGVMPQTIEAINHAKAADVSIIVAINKIDKEGSEPEKIKQQLMQQELVLEEWGGSVPCIEISAKTNKNIDVLLETILLMAQIKDLKASPNRKAKGTVLEVRLDKNRGPAVTILVQNGTLKKGDLLVAGTSVGHVRDMLDDKGKKIKKAGPSVPVEITGLDSLPNSGDIFDVVSDERLAKELVEQRKAKQKEKRFQTQPKVTVDNFLDQMELENTEELKIFVKADVQGSAQALKESLETLSNEKVKINVIYAGAGTINESDVSMANASNAVIIGFNTKLGNIVEKTAKLNKTDIRLYSVIYDCIKDIENTAKKLIKPETEEIVLGHAECRHLYKISGIGTIAGSYVTDGEIRRNAKIRVQRDSVSIVEDTLSSLKRFKEDVKEVTKGYECGIKLLKFSDVKKGDIFEAYTIEKTTS